jgi:two-component SAPR family response regulator
MSESATARPLRVLIVEDNLLIAETVAEMLEKSGCAVLGPLPDVASGLALLERERFDAAMLDVNLAGSHSFPLAAVLKERAIPFVFTTGYAETSVFPPEFRSVARITKPYDQEAIDRVVNAWRQVMKA